MTHPDHTGTPEWHMNPQANRHVQIEMLLVVVATGGLSATAAVLIERYFGFPSFAPLALLALIGAISVERIGSYHPYDRLGWANVTTFGRAGIIVLFAAPLFATGLHILTPVEAWIAAGVALFTLALDGLDGFIARKQRLTSRFGARLDMELDALFILLLSGLAWQNHKAGAWVLVLGILRYAFVLAGRFLPALNMTLPPSQRRKIICVVQVVVLIALLLPFITPPFSQLLAVAALASLVWSFAVDIKWQLRNYPS